MRLRTEQAKEVQDLRAMPSERQSFQWQLKGGRTRHKKGYLLLRVPDHPRASGGYVFEHILVMEKQLGRYLRPDETVHHVNGVKDDNRPTNLELWLRPQPSGIRVVDAIAWAREILSRYDGNHRLQQDSGAT